MSNFPERVHKLKVQGHFVDQFGKLGYRNLPGVGHSSLLSLNRVVIGKWGRDSSSHQFAASLLA